MYSTAPYVWVVSHLQVIGWPAFFYGIYWVIKTCYKVGRAAATVEQRVLAGEQTLHLMASNHVPHLQLELEKANETLGDIREELKIARIARAGINA